MGGPSPRRPPWPQGIFMNAEKYNPRYTLSEEAVNLIAEISAAIERFNSMASGMRGIRLRKTNRIKTIRGSTAIEGNSLTEEQITAVLEGRRVVAPKKEIDEVLGAAAAYEQIEQIDRRPHRGNILDIRTTGRTDAQWVEEKGISWTDGFGQDRRLACENTMRFHMR